jgi:dsDNA-specific endonuclease/ATPase MutS2
MSVTTDRPSAAELEELTGLLNAPALDRRALSGALARLEQGLRVHGRDLDETGGLLNEGDKARRMSLAREDDRLRDEVTTLLADVRGLRDAVAGSDDDELRRRGGEVLAGLRGHRNAEASLVLENADTEVGSGD